MKIQNPDVQQEPIVITNVEPQAEPVKIEVKPVYQGVLTDDVLAELDQMNDGWPNPRENFCPDFPDLFIDGYIVVDTLA